MLGLSNNGVYTSPFDDWLKNAAVRKLEPHYAEEANTLPFSRELVPVLPFVPSDAKLENRLLFAGLNYYFSKTSILETSLIAPCANYVFSGGLVQLVRAGVADRIPPQMLRDARWLTIDEDFHAAAEQSVVQQAAQALDIQNHAPQSGASSFLESYLHDVRTVAVRDARLLQICTAAVTEMCLSKTLCILPKDTTVNSGVRELIDHHARDERRHFYYHRSLLQVVWPGLERGQRSFVAERLPRIITDLLRFDEEFWEAQLAQEFTRRQAREIVKKAYVTEQESERIYHASLPIVHTLSSLGAFEDRNIRRAFEQYDLLREHPDVWKAAC